MCRRRRCSQQCLSLLPHTDAGARCAHDGTKQGDTWGGDDRGHRLFHTLLKRLQKKYACISVLFPRPANRPQIASYQAVQDRSRGAWSMMRQDPDGFAARAGISRARHVGAKGQHSLSMPCLPPRRFQLSLTSRASADQFALASTPADSASAALVPPLSVVPLPLLPAPSHGGSAACGSLGLCATFPRLAASIERASAAARETSTSGPYLLLCVTAHRKGSLWQGFLPPQHAGGLTPTSRVQHSCRLKACRCAAPRCKTESKATPTPDKYLPAVHYSTR